MDQSSQSFKIVNVTRQGEGVARPEGEPVCFVPRALPGESVSVVIHKQHKTWSRASIAEILEPANNREDSYCGHYGQCGGCSWLHTDPASEIRYKEEEVLHLLTRACPSLPAPEPSAILARKSHRDRIRIRVTKLGEVAFAAPWPDQDKLSPLPAAGCPAISDILNVRLQEIVSEKVYQGPGELSLITNGDKNAEMFAAESAPPQVPPSPLSIPWYDGRIYLSPDSFFQPSRAGLQIIAETLRSWTEGQTANRIWDLFGGQGSWARSLLDRCEKATIIEQDKSALNLVRLSPHPKLGVKRQNLARVPHINPEKGDWIIVNPPRTGLSRALCQWLKACEVTQILYVSCDPATLARDLALLKESWKVTKWRVTHQYPGTKHVETACQLVPV